MFFEKLANLWPEAALLIGALLCLTLGLSGSAARRALTPAAALLALLLAAVLAWLAPGNATDFSTFVKLATAGLGVLLLGVAVGLPEGFAQNRAAERAANFEPGDSDRGEFYAFFLLSLSGLMMVGGAGDLVWLFLALELVSLPTYIMIATTRTDARAHESAVKYFFLGALGAAVFLYGFALIYGGTGAVNLNEISAAIAAQVSTGQGLNALTTLGLVVASLGLCFKIAAVPMHLYAADVYQGAATPVTTFLAVVPKFAGFTALLLLAGVAAPAFTDGPLTAVLGLVAILTMTLGNVLALVQTSVKRTLAYSSIAHSGYALLGLLAGPMFIGDPVLAGSATPTALGDGAGAVLFYLLAYGAATIAAFGVLGSLARTDERTGEEAEADGYAALQGLWRHHPVRAAVMVVAMLSLLGLPPLAGFAGKVYLAAAALRADLVVLVVVLVINSAISAGYYLRIAGVCLLGVGDDRTYPVAAPLRTAAAAVAAALAVLLGTGLASPLTRAASHAGAALTTPVESAARLTAAEPPRD